MILRAYTLYDVKALQYHSPYFTHTDGMAVRMLTDLVNEGGNNVSRHPRDFTLYQCGHYDDQTGIFTPLVPLQFVSDAISLVRAGEVLPLEVPRVFSEDKPAVQPNGKG